MSAMENKEGKKKNNFFAPVTKYFREVKSELKKVVFPTAKQTRINTTVVIASVIVVGIIIGVLDFAFNAARNYVINYDTNKQTEQSSQTDAAQQQTAPQTDAASQPEMTAEQAQAILTELDSYTYDDKGNAVDENGKTVVLKQNETDENGLELTAANVASIRAQAQSVIDNAAGAAGAEDTGKQDAGTDATAEGSND